MTTPIKQYKAVFNMHGFTKEIETFGDPPMTVGFPIPSNARTDKSKSLSLYFRLINFDGEVATYTLDDWREML